MNDGSWGDRDTEDLVAERLKFIGALLEEDTEVVGDTEGAAEAAKSEAPAAAVDGPSPGPGGRPVAARVRRSRTALVAVLGLAAVVAGVVLTAVWAPWSADSDAEAKPDQSGIVSCAKLIVEGTVAGTDAAGGGKVGVRLDVQRYVKPGKGPDEVRFEVPREDAAAYRTGARVLVSVSRFGDEVPLLFTGSEIAPAEEWMAAEVDKPDAPACPGRV
ncbi:hypothetical protein [Streptomyces sp. Ag109_G2-15]|uniref:hypothetical protein n=1 Tax=Streptomyces sp. Ag109_G2-15 TaxID=1938850 RepID=UPI000BD81EFC|nr:hypothetical protein [Streptomyces sp. Ag109_G2-15]SOD86257.1 hypothetical protein SAMN06272765_3708 [Streptomyces sp. Ag109_G2-15]